MRLSIVVPTIDGREDELAKTVEAYERLTPTRGRRKNPRVELEWIVEWGHDNCGAAWNAGAARATGELLHMTADDLEPETSRWFASALDAVERDCVPLGLVREDWGSFGHDFCRVPFCRTEWWLDVPEIHYFSDNAFGDLMLASGHHLLVAEGFDFHHRRSMIGRDESPERLARDFAGYRSA